MFAWGSGYSSVVRASDLFLKGHGFESLQERRDFFLSRVNFLCWLLFWYLFHPRVTAAARKRPRSFCQKCKWQVTAKHACTLPMWLCMKWHGAWLYGVHRTRRDGSSFMWNQPCQRCKYITSVDIFKKALQKAIQSCRITCERSESARERRIALYKSDQHQQQLLLSSYRPPADKPRVLLQPVRTPHIHFGAKSPKSGHYAGPSRKIRTVEQQTDRLQTKPLK